MWERRHASAQAQALLARIAPPAPRGRQRPAALVAPPIFVKSSAGVSRRAFHLVVPPENSMALYRIGDVSPRLGERAWVADSATVVGRVELGEDASVWYGAVLRGDNEWITIGARTNIQDGSVLHTDMGSPLTLGADVTVGHQVMMHGCTVGENSLIGIQSVVMNGARIGRNSIVGAGALVTEGKEFPDNSLIVGSPARAIRTLTDEQVAKLKMSAAHYVQNAARHRDTVVRIDEPATGAPAGATSASDGE
jgi:carbonic anhydrase/acetyltransferase-like protein (isoleucine patch superfamily)